jgi:Mg2+/Co2+ transporter CorB
LYSEKSGKRFILCRLQDIHIPVIAVIVVAIAVTRVLAIPLGLVTAVVEVAVAIVVEAIAPIATHLSLKPDQINLEVGMQVFMVSRLFMPVKIMTMYIIRILGRAMTVLTIKRAITTKKEFIIPM